MVIVVTHFFYTFSLLLPPLVPWAPTGHLSGGRIMTSNIRLYIKIIIILSKLQRSLDFYVNY